MATSILVPQVGQDLTEGKIVALHVKVGDTVSKGDIVAEVESEKATFEVEAFETGVVVDLCYKVGDVAEVLKPLLFLGEPGESVRQSTRPASAPARDINIGERPAASRPAGTGGGAGRASPLARRLAARHGLDLFDLEGTGPNGTVVKRDIENALASAPGTKTETVRPQWGSAPALIKAVSNAIALRSLQTGTGDPVVFLHGFGGELAAWRPFIGHVSVANPMLAFDLPGHGQSVDHRSGDFDGLVDSCYAALTSAGARRIHLVGHSLGAAAAAALAGAGSVDVRSLTMISPAGLGPKINGDFLSGFLTATSEAALKSWMQLLVFDPANLPGAMVRATSAARDGTAAAANQARLARSLFEGDTQLFSVRDALRRFAGPARIVVGRNDAIIPAEHIDPLPGHVALHRLPQVGHLPQLEASGLVGRLVAETIRSAN